MKGLTRLIPSIFLLAAVSLGEAPNPKSHTKAVSGAITALDTASKSLTVKDAKGKETRLVLTGATRVTGGTLKIGEQVTVRWMTRDKKKVATIVQVQAPEAESTAVASGTAEVTPTPKTE
ncbi:MAG TPA: hypothetical protein VMR54_05290 [Thermoanaerobaculia bacterium]|nr:hypothetical protein [Thermoanaerobaculia bacterium]